MFVVEIYIELLQNYLKIENGETKDILSQEISWAENNKEKGYLELEAHIPSIRNEDVRYYTKHCLKVAKERLNADNPEPGYIDFCSYFYEQYIKHVKHY